MKEYFKRREQIREHVLDTDKVSVQDAPDVFEKLAWGETVHLTQSFARTRQFDRSLRHAIGGGVGGAIFAVVSFSAAGALMPALVAGACCVFALAKLVDCASKLNPNKQVEVKQKDFDGAYRRVMTDMFLLSQVRTISDTMGDIANDANYPEQDRLKFAQLKSGQVDLGLANVTWFFRVASHKRMADSLAQHDQQKAKHVHETAGELYEAMLPKTLQTLASGLFRGESGGYNDDLGKATRYLNNQVQLRWEDMVKAPRYDRRA